MAARKFASLPLRLIQRKVNLRFSHARASANLLHRVPRRLRAAASCALVRTAHANGADNLSIHQQRNSSLHPVSRLKAKNAQSISTCCHGLKCLGRPLEHCGCPRLVDATSALPSCVLSIFS